MKRLCHCQMHFLRPTIQQSGFDPAQPGQDTGLPHHDKLVGNLFEEYIHKLEVYTFATANHFNNSTCLKKHFISHIKHYMNSKDFVSRLGVLNFSKSEHMLNQHYLDTIFPFDPDTSQVIDTNDFVEMLVDEIMVLGGQNISIKLIQSW